MPNELGCVQIIRTNKNLVLIEIKEEWSFLVFYYLNIECGEGYKTYTNLHIGLI